MFWQLMGSLRLGYISGWLIFFASLGALALLLPQEVFTPESSKFILIIGAIGIWRYSNGMTHFLRGIWFLYVVFPRWRAKANKLGQDALPPHVYLMVTSFRIDTQTTAAVYNSVFAEAKSVKAPCTVVCSIVEVCDEMLIRALFDRQQMPAQVALKFVRIPGTGKRDGLAFGFRAISRDMPSDDAVVAVIDGDTVLEPGMVNLCTPFFKMMPKMGALTTNEFCEVQGSHIMSEWHKLRFGQRHINMCSMALSNRVLTLTGRMSVFRASVVTHPDFIFDVQNDSIQHWRLGKFRFLTGDDKSSWFSVMKMGMDTFYVPDAAIRTVEHPPDNNFFRATKQLMFRWYGNNLRQNSRAVKLGPTKLGWFTYYVINDQRISMWTSLVGLSVATIGSLKYSFQFMLVYLLWVLLTRTFITLMIRASGHSIGPLYPVILYYNQIVGAVMKIYVFFRLDRQSWTRQPTKLQRDLASFQRLFNKWSSRVVTFASVSVFAALVFAIV